VSRRAASQVIVDPQKQPEVAAKAERLRAEYVVAVTGSLRLRQDPNPRLKTGTLEISPSDIKVRQPPLLGW
jgi:aspartyl-tRNA synthetase